MNITWIFIMCLRFALNLRISPSSYIDIKGKLRRAENIWDQL